MDRPTCHGCRHLYREPDAAGGGMWRCAVRPGSVVGEYGFWEPDPEPRQFCGGAQYEPLQQMGVGTVPEYTVGLDDGRGNVHAGVSRLTTEVACGANLFMASATDIERVTYSKCLAAMRGEQR